MIDLNQSFLTDQLIPYIGSKRKLLDLILEAIQRTGAPGGVFFDAFAGSGVVSRMAKMMGFQVISNDWEPYAQIVNRAYITVNKPPRFMALGGMQRAFDLLNTLPGQKGYIATHYCPKDDENYDVDRERMFYTQSNGRRIDAIREQILSWRNDAAINDDEEAVLLAPLIFQAAYCSNTSGVFKGFHRGWGGATSTALYRIRSRLTLRVPVFYDNGQANEVLGMDAAEAAKLLKCNIAYLDPPYNQHQYGSNYHLLNTVALWDKPPVHPNISSNGARDKSAIRKDWRSSRRSLYCSRRTALQAFQELLKHLRSQWVLVSYSTDGIIPYQDLLSVLAEHGRLDVLTRLYKRYRVSSQRPSPKSHTVEFVAILNTREAGQGFDLRNALETISSALSAGQVSDESASYLLDSGVISSKGVVIR